MKITIAQFGEIEFEEDKIIHFKEGILGFEELTKYLLITQEDNTFFWLTSIDQPEIIFPMFPIGLLKENYPEEESYEAFGIVNLNKDPLKITINLKAPVYINQEKKIGIQKILDNDKFPIDYKLFVEN